MSLSGRNEQTPDEETSGSEIVIEIGDPETGLVSPKEMGEIEHRLRSLGADPGVRVIVLRGRSSTFCAGMVDGPWPERYAGRDLAIEGHPRPPVPQQELVKTLFTIEKPTVAVLHGDVRGYGLDLASACDLRVADRSATIGDGRLRTGGGDWCDTGITYLLPRLVGLSRAQQIVLLGDTLDASVAHDIGLVYALADASDLSAAVEALSSRLASMATRSYGLIKQQIVGQLALSYDMALMHSLAVRQTNVIEDRHEADEAFRAGRVEQYTGR